MTATGFSICQVLFGAVVCYLSWKLILLIQKYRCWIKAYRGVTSIGPSHPIWGHLHLIQDAESLMYLYNSAVAKTRGKVLGAWLFCFPFFAVTHPDTIKLLVKSSEPKPVDNTFQAVGRKIRHVVTTGHVYPSRAPIATFNVFEGDGILLSSGRKWERNRRLLTPAFHYEILVNYVKISNAVAELFIGKLWKTATNGDAVEIYKPCILATLDTMLRCAFSYEGDIQCEGAKNPYAHASKQLSLISITRMLEPLKWFDFIFYKLTTDGRDFKRYSDFVHDFADDIIKARRESLSNNPSQVDKKKLDFLDILLTATDDNGIGLSDADIRAEVDTFLFAGHDTTASAISWAIFALAKYPEDQEKVAEDVRSVMEEREDVNWEDLQKFRYLNLFIREVLRMYCPVPFISRTLTRPIKFEGVEIPTGLTIDISIVSLHHNPDVFPDHEVFRPDRFTKENSEGRDPYAFIPFSAGPRNCIGQNFALNEIRVFIARLVQRYKVSLDSPKDAEFCPDAVVRPRNGIKIFMSKRSDNVTA